VTWHREQAHTALAHSHAGDDLEVHLTRVSKVTDHIRVSDGII
jgi:hypothetical protein